jgi:hypothetical protein
LVARFLSEKLQNVMAVTDVLALFWQPPQSSRTGGCHEKGIDLIGSPLRTAHRADWRHVPRWLISEGG